jgi:hypothetical protein
MNNITSKRFVIRKSLLNTNTNITFTTKKGKEITYSHDKVFNIMKETLTNLPCWLKYKSYTATNNIPVALRDKDLV